MDEILVCGTSNGITDHEYGPDYYTYEWLPALQQIKDDYEVNYIAWHWGFHYSIIGCFLAFVFLYIFQWILSLVFIIMTAFFAAFMFVLWNLTALLFIIGIWFPFLIICMYLLLWVTWTLWMIFVWLLGFPVLGMWLSYNFTTLGLA